MICSQCRYGDRADNDNQEFCLRWRRERKIGAFWVLHSSVPPVVKVGYGIARPAPSGSRSSSERSYR